MRRRMAMGVLTVWAAVGDAVLWANTGGHVRPEEKTMTGLNGSPEGGQFLAVFHILEDDDYGSFSDKCAGFVDSSVVVSAARELEGDRF